MGSNRNPLTRAEAIAAATSCIERFGVQKTSMTDVAKLLGVTRQTVHRLFDSRNQLIEAVAEKRIEALARKLAKEFEQFADLETALIEGSMMSLAFGRSDPVLLEIQEQADHSVDQYMFRGSPKVQKVMLSLWGPLIDAALREGRLRSELNREVVVEWIRNVHAMLNMRDDYDDGRKIEMLRQFIVPSIFASC